MKRKEKSITEKQTQGISISKSLVCVVFVVVVV